MRIVRTLLVAALTWEARVVLSRYQPRIIAITGSVGKTTTKDAIYAVLSKSLHVRKSDKSFNSEIGVPLTILGCENAWHNPLKWALNLFLGLRLILLREEYPKWLVLEVGADRPGDIRSISSWLRPEIAVITGVPEIPAHVEYFGSREALMKEKRILVEHLRPGGALVINGDDTVMIALCEEWRGVMTRYGFEPGNDFRAANEEIAYDSEKPVGMKFELHHQGHSMQVPVHGALGRPRVYAALAAFAVAGIAGVKNEEVARELLQWSPPPGRMRVLKGMKEATIIDDTYNSSPAAALSALDTLREVRIQKGGRKIAVLGDMLELGKYSSEAHKNIGVRATESADILITVGFRARATVEAALDAGMREKNIRQYEHNESRRAGEELKLELKEGDIVLVKGSQSMRMERVVYELLAEPQKAPELLVRQDEEWLHR